MQHNETNETKRANLCNALTVTGCTVIGAAIHAGFCIITFTDANGDQHEISTK